MSTIPVTQQEKYNLFWIIYVSLTLSRTLLLDKHSNSNTWSPNTWIHSMIFLSVLVVLLEEEIEKVQVLIYGKRKMQKSSDY